jgi:single-strand DNA-binding protein
MAKIKSTPGTKKLSKVEKIGKVNKSVKVAKTLESKTKVSKKIAVDEFSPVNEVRLVGRVTSLAVEKELPSGDKVVEFRVVIGRGKMRNGKKEVDSLDIAAWSAKARRAALAVKIDSWIEVKGSVRRRFWRAPTGLASRWQVEASEVVRL